MVYICRFSLRLIMDSKNCLYVPHSAFKKGCTPEALLTELWSVVMQQSHYCFCTMLYHAVSGAFNYYENIKIV